MTAAKTGSQPDSEPASETTETATLTPLTTGQRLAALFGERAIDIGIAAVDRSLAVASAAREQQQRVQRIFDGLRFDVYPCGDRLRRTTEAAIEAVERSPRTGPSILRRAAGLIDDMIRCATFPDDDPELCEDEPGRAEAMRLRDELAASLEREGVSIAQHEIAAKALKFAASELEGC